MGLHSSGSKTTARLGAFESPRPSNPPAALPAGPGLPLCFFCSYRRKHALPPHYFCPKRRISVYLSLFFLTGKSVICYLSTIPRHRGRGALFISSPGEAESRRTRGKGTSAEAAGPNPLLGPCQTGTGLSHPALPAGWGALLRQQQARCVPKGDRRPAAPRSAPGKMRGHRNLEPFAAPPFWHSQNARRIWVKNGRPSAFS